MSLIRLSPHRRDLGEGFMVRRLLPDVALRTIGPFVFFDHMGPVDFSPGDGLDVRRHPHIGLATVTWLFDGAIRHRDSLNTVLDIRPGAVNWMIAGRGISHSERSPPDERAAGHRLHGIQTWVALPLADEEMAPDFVHVPASAVPRRDIDGGCIHIVAGDAWGLTSPVPVRSRTLYLVAQLEAGATFELPADHVERAVYCVSGALDVAGEALAEGEMLAVEAGVAHVRASEPSLVVVLGGDPLDRGPEGTVAQPRHLRWNYVSSSAARLEAATDAWQRQDSDVFPPIDGEDDYIPWPPPAVERQPSG